MKTSTIVGVLVVLVVVLGGWYWWSMNGGPAIPMFGTATTTPAGQAGINDSANQGNLGQPSSGTPQQPGGTAADDQGVGDASSPGQPGADGAEGSVIGSNVALGTASLAGNGFGTFLIGYNGMAVYTSNKDTGSVSSCYGTCAVNWPPYLVGPEDNVANVKAGVTGKVDTIVRTDGGIQVTYNGQPLYFYRDDSRPGQPDGDDIIGWDVARP